MASSVHGGVLGSVQMPAPVQDKRDEGCAKEAASKSSAASCDETAARSVDAGYTCCKANRTHMPLREQSFLQVQVGKHADDWRGCRRVQALGQWHSMCWRLPDASPTGSKKKTNKLDRIVAPRNSIIKCAEESYESIALGAAPLPLILARQTLSNGQCQTKPPPPADLP